MQVAHSTVGGVAPCPDLVDRIEIKGSDDLRYLPGFDELFRELIGRAALLDSPFSPGTAVRQPFRSPRFSLADGSLSISGQLRDRRNVEPSPVAIARAMARFAGLPPQGFRAAGEEGDCGQRIHRLAKSMGVHAIRLALAESRRPRDRDVLFGHPCRRGHGARCAGAYLEIGSPGTLGGLGAPLHQSRGRVGGIGDEFAELPTFPEAVGRRIRG